MENITNLSPNPIQSEPLENLFPALIECFAVIICGYITGRLGLVTQDQTNGLSTFVSIFSLPSIIFMSLATLDLTAVCWYFLLSVLVAKAIIFLIVLFVTLFITKPTDPARSGLYAIFCTQSNDFALGFPIVLSVYGKTHPEFVSYLYLLAPVSLVILNPIGFVLMEFAKYRSEESLTKLKLIGNTFKSIATNPVVLMTALGIIGNLTFHHKVPQVLASVLNVFGSAFTATALFLLGLRMVGRVQKLQGSALLVTAVLITMKELALPITIREITSLILNSASINKTEATDMSTYGFLYGTFPAAPGVFVYATSYNLEIDLIASGMVICTFLSAPLMFISAKMIAVSSLLPSHYFSALTNFEFDLSIFGLIASGWLIVIFILNDYYKKLPQQITFFLIISQMIGCIGVILGFIGLRYIDYAIITFGEYSIKCWTASLAVTLVILESRNFSFLLRLIPVFGFISWCLPGILICILMLTTTSEESPVNHYESFSYGKAEATITIFIQLLSFLVTVISLIIQQRNRRRHKRYLIYVREASAASDVDGNNFSEASNTTVQRHDSSQSLIEPNRDTLIDEAGGIESVTESQIMHHMVLIIFLTCSTFISLSLSVWRIIMEELTGVYIELAFLNVAFIRGQSILILLIFGAETIAVIMPFLKQISLLWCNDDSDSVISWDSLADDVKETCEQFNNIHLELCRTQIVSKKRVQCWRYKDCFTGTSLVDWLLSENLIENREIGTNYGKQLFTGGIIKGAHNSVTEFTDNPSLFIFTPINK